MAPLAAALLLACAASAQDGDVAQALKKQSGGPPVAGAAVRPPDGKCSETISHADGQDTWTFPVTCGDDPYAASGSNSLLASAAAPAAAGSCSAFSEDLKLMTRFGTFRDEASEADVTRLILDHHDAYGNSETVRRALAEAARDRLVLAVARAFFEDGGKMAVSPVGGEYMAKEKKIVIPPACLDLSGCVPELNRSGVIFHELLHYVFDKCATQLARSQGAGGADHYAIHPLEERYRIVALIRQGRSPARAEFTGLNGFLKDGKLLDGIRHLSAKKDYAELKEFLSSRRFVSHYVKATMMETAADSARAKAQPSEGIYQVSAAQSKDISAIAAGNAEIVRRALLIAVDVAEKAHTRWELVLAWKPFQDRFKAWQAAQ
jgi:hypothetical protein